MSISVCMIAKDAEKTIGNALDSIKDIADEIIVVDTGSSDKTKDVATSKGAQVFDFTWVDDFSKARNESLKHATKDWILVLDSDEIITKEDAENIKKLISADDNHVGYRLTQHNYSDESSLSGWMPTGNLPGNGAKGYTRTSVIRLFKNNLDASFTGVVHERIDSSLQGKGSIGTSDIMIHNYGNVDQGATKKKKAWYLELAKKNVSQSPSAQAYFDLGVLEKETGNIDQAIAAQQQCIALDKTFALSHFELGVLYEQQQELEKAITCYEEAALIKPFGSAFLGIGNCQIKQGKLQDAFRNLKKSLLLNPNNPQVHLKLGYIHEKNKQFPQAIKAYIVGAKLNPNNPSAFLNLGNAYLGVKNLGQAAQAYQEAIKLGHPNKDAIEKRLAEVQKHIENIKAQSAQTGTVNYDIEFDPR